MRNLRFFVPGVTLVLLLGLVGVRTAAAATPTECDLRLTVELTPDVPDPSDAGFLSSLLNNHPGYRLDLLRVIDPALVELDLSGPGPGYMCVDVIVTMRKDARVLSVRIDSGETPNVVAADPGEVNISRVGLESLYWAAFHPSEAWRVLLPIRSGGNTDSNPESSTLP